MPINFNPEHVLPGSLVANQRSVAQHFDDGYYRRRFTPGEFVLALGAQHATVGTNRWPAIEYPEGALTYGVVAFERPSLWISGKLKITFYYTSDTGSTDDFALSISARALPAGANLGTGFTQLKPNAPLDVVPGPAVAEDELSEAVYTVTSFEQSAKRIGIRFGRDGTDAADVNTGVFYLTELVVEHIPADQEVHLVP